MLESSERRLGSGGRRRKFGQTSKRCLTPPLRGLALSIPMYSPVLPVRVFNPPTHNREPYDTLLYVLSNIMSL